MAGMDADHLSSGLGGAVRQWRLTLGLTLDGLAARSGVSRAMLSDVERGAKSPTIRVLCQIAEGLGCSVSDLLSGPPGDRPNDVVSILRAPDRPVLVDPDSGVERRLLSPNPRRAGVEVVLYVVPPGRETGEFPPHRPGTREHVTVMRGELVGRIGEIEIGLSTGDSAAFPADVPHGFRNPAAEPCEFLLVIDGPRSPGQIRP
jgi:transcriptional regulator with XRE-family HTH domain